MEPLCLRPFNDARECMFQIDAATFACQKWINEYTHCQLDPKGYAEFLKNSTEYQKKKKVFSFDAYHDGHDRHV